MSDRPLVGEDVLSSNHALREWAAGLREWSRVAREVAAMQRTRSIEFRETRLTTRRTYDGVWGSADPSPTTGAEAGPTTPGLGEVQLSELFTVLVDHHGFGFMDAVQTLTTALTFAGYPVEADEVAAADAFEIVDWAVSHR